MNEALSEFEPQLLIYNAGTDVLQGDKLGGLALTERVSIRCRVNFRIGTTGGSKRCDRSPLIIILICE